MFAPQRHAPEVLLLPIGDFAADVPAHQVVPAQEVRVGGIGEFVQRYAGGVQGAPGGVLDIEGDAFEPIAAVLHTALAPAHRLALAVDAQVPVEDGLGNLTRMAESEEAAPPRAAVEVSEAHVVANDARSPGAVAQPVGVDRMPLAFDLDKPGAPAALVQVPCEEIPGGAARRHV